MAIYPVEYANLPVDASAAFPAGRVAHRPIIRLALLNGVHRLDCYAIVDSGADHCVFPRSFMHPLGLDPLTTPVEGCNGVGNSGVTAHFCYVTLDLQEVLQYQIYAGFTVGLEPWGVGLLGQNDFFDKFKVTFDLANGIFSLEVPDAAPVQQ